MNCDYQPHGDAYQCTNCGDIRRRIVARKCRAPGAAEPPANASRASYRRPAAVEAIITTHCRPCTHYPCLAEKNCTHADALILGAACPRNLFTGARRWITHAERTALVLDLLTRLPPEIDAVAGIPRSGMAPAGMIAEARHLPLLAISRENGLTAIGHGARLRKPAERGTLLIVDDSIASGTSLRRITDHLARLAAKSAFRPTATITCALYAEPENATRADIIGRLEPLPHYFAWNFANSSHSPTTAWDFDGALCNDCPAAALPHVDEAAYRQHLAEARPILLPRSLPIPLIVTARMEAYRAESLAWLTRWGIRADKMIMARDRQASWNPVKLKAEAYAAAGEKITIFLESDPLQARDIAAQTGKRVICPPAALIFN